MQLLLLEHATTHMYMRCSSSSMGQHTKMLLLEPAHVTIHKRCSSSSIQQPWKCSSSSKSLFRMLLLEQSASLRTGTQRLHWQNGTHIDKRYTTYPTRSDHVKNICISSRPTVSIVILLYLFYFLFCCIDKSLVVITDLLTNKTMKNVVFTGRPQAEHQ